MQTQPRMRIVRPQVRLVAETRFALRPEEGVPWQVWETPSARDAEVLAEFAGRLCYQSWHRPNPATARNEDYLRNILASAHYSVLEHAGFTVVLTGVSRAFTHEVVRHRHFSFSQLSQRFVDEAGCAVVVPPLLRDDPEALSVLEEVYRVTQEAYGRLVEIAQRRLAHLPDRRMRRKRAREAARCVLPNYTETHIVMTGNHRAWREFFEKRGSVHADAEMREVAVMIFTEVARPLAPHIYQDFEVVDHPLPGGETVRVLERRPLSGPGE